MDKYAHMRGAMQHNAYAHGKPPTPAQAKAGNYRKAHVTLHGFDIAIENPLHSVREGVDKSGKPWRNTMMADYGHILGTVGADGDQVDTFIGAWPESEQCWVINQIDPSTGKFDEAKVMLAFTDKEAAINAYQGSYDRDWRGLGSIIPCTVDQLKWWLKFGNTKGPISSEALPHDGSTNMKEITWDSAAQPVGTDFAGLIYALRTDDADGLMLDSCSIADIMEDSEGELTLDALVVPVAKLERKMTQLQAIMNMAGDNVKVVAMQITPPFKQRGTTNVAAVYELSDGQTVSVFFHNPDTTPNKLAPGDELVSWKWLLNKKDITMLVAPEKGMDLNPREVSRRIMRIAEKNSARFAQSNKNRAARMASIEVLKADVSTKEATAQALDAEIADLAGKVEAKRATRAPMPENTEILPENLSEIAPERVPVAIEPVPVAPAPALVAAIAEPIQSEAPPVAPTATQNLDPTSAEGYAEVMASPSLQEDHQDELDSFFQGRVIEVRNALRGFGWEGERYKPLTRVIDNCTYIFDPAYQSVGEGANIVGWQLQVKADEGKGIYLAGVVEDGLTKTPEQLAGEVNALATAPVQEQPAAIEAPPVPAIAPAVAIDMPAPAPLVTDGAERETDTAFLQSIINGSADVMAPEVADQLVAIAEKYTDPEMNDLVNQAAEAYSSAVIDKAKQSLAA